MYRKRETENPNLVRDLDLIGRDNSWRAQCSDIHISHYIPFTLQLIRALCKVAHYCHCYDTKCWEGKVSGSLSQAWHASVLNKILDLFYHEVHHLVSYRLVSFRHSGRRDKLKDYSNKYFKLWKMRKSSSKQISRLLLYFYMCIKSLH